MRVFIAACILVALAAGAYMYTRPAPAAPEMIPGQGNPVVGKVSESSTETFDMLVTFNGEVFEPKELSVKKGTRVRFLNVSDVEVWPASAVHPTHSIYPEKDSENCLGSSFDSCRGLKKDEFFDFTFNYTGEWRYHDHIKAFKTGSVTVTD